MTPFPIFFLFLSLATANMGPPKPSKTLGPTVLTDCGCTSFLSVITTCQQLNPLTFSAHKSCICNGSWYSAGMGCRDCLLLATGGSEKERPFYDAFGQTISQTFVACTEAGASVKVVDEKDTGKGICGWSSFGGFACVGLDVGKGKGWASMVDRDTKEVKVMWAEIDGLTEGGKATATTSSAKEKASQTEEKGVVVSAIATTGPEETESAAASSSAASPAPTGSAGPNSAAGRKGLESSLALVGIVVLLVAAY